MSDRLIVEGLRTLNEIFSGRNTLYHGTSVRAAEAIKRSRSFNTSVSYGSYGSVADKDYTYISFARSRGSDFTPGDSSGLFVVYEFKKNGLRRNTKREKASFEAYDDSEVGDVGKYRGGLSLNYYNWGEPTQRSRGMSELEERLWFRDGRDSSRGVFNSIDKIHIVFEDKVDPDKLEDILNKIEIDGVDTLFYKNYRDWLQGKAFFDPFQYLE